MLRAHPRQRAAHAAPGRGVWRSVGTTGPRHARLAPGPLPGLLLTLTGGGLAALALLPVAVDASPAPASSIRAASGTAPQAIDLTERQSARASRSRTAPEPEQAPTAAALAAVPAPAPVAPRPVLPGCSGRGFDLGRYANGRVPARVLCALPGTSGERLRGDAAVAFVRLAEAYERDLGSPLCLSDGYRPLGEQKVLRRTKPRLAARPGTSEHGWGLAVDLACGIQSYRTAQHAWMVRNASRFGWYLPDWARRSGARPEPWHWQYAR